MAGWRDDYLRRLTTPEKAVRSIAAGSRIALPTLAGQPPALIEALGRAAAEGQVEGLRLSAILPGRDVTQHILRPEYANRLHWDSLFCSGGDRAAVFSGVHDMTPMHFGQTPRIMRAQPVQAVMTLASTPDEEGYVSLGISIDYTRALFETARHRLIEINPAVPHMRGPARVHIAQADAIVEADRALIELPNPPLAAEDETIGRLIAERIPNGATIQIGYGAVPSAVALALTDHRHLGVHTEMFVDNLRPLIEAGVIDNSLKTINPGKTIYTFCAGTMETYRFLDDHPAIEGHPVDYTNDPHIIAQHKNMISINATIVVDLTGQACSESLGGMQYSGTGGQVDFVRGATQSDGGRSFLATASTAKSGAISCIVDMLPSGSVVTTSRTDIDCVVTEFGIAELRGRSLRERAQALIAIAHPKFHDQLQEAARARGLGPR
jgi:acyl-CoA hydrolase